MSQRKSPLPLVIGGVVVFAMLYVVGMTALKDSPYFLMFVMLGATPILYFGPRIALERWQQAQKKDGEPR